ARPARARSAARSRVAREWDGRRSRRESTRVRARWLSRVGRSPGRHRAREVRARLEGHAEGLQADRTAEARGIEGVEEVAQRIVALIQGPNQRAPVRTLCIRPI
ncbi:MAG: hypothetical protein ACK55I_13640, partial [bacterium]